MQRRIDREGRIKQFKKRLHQKRVEREVEDVKSVLVLMPEHMCSECFVTVNDRSLPIAYQNLKRCE